MTKQRQRRKPEQIVKLLQEGERLLAAGKTQAEIYQKLEVSDVTWARWQKKYGGMRFDEAKRLRELEVENRRLKRELARVTEERDILKKATVYFARGSQ